jgi:hypothetical protein
MNENHKSLYDESDDVLDRAIRAAAAQSPPSDVKNRVVETAAAWRQQVHIAAGDGQPAANDVSVEEAREVQSGSGALARSLGPVERAVPEEQGHPSRVRIGVSNNHFLGKVKNMIVTHKRLSAAAAATLTALAASMVLYVSVFSSPGSAYALEQTAQANARVTSYHVKVTPAPLDQMGEAWIQLNPDGSLLRVKMEIFSPDDGPKVSIVSKDRAEVWFKMKHSHVILGDKPLTEKVFKEIEATRAYYDPKLAFEQLQADKKAGKVQVETSEPTEEGQPVILTVTSKETPDKQQLFDVDPQTKLVERVFDMGRKDGRWQVVQMREYLDYNKEFDPSVFQLVTPKGFVTVDRIKTKVGLEKGNLTDDEIATKVAKEFIEALIARDYQKASPLFSGIPAEQLKKLFERKPNKFLRIVEIGKPMAGKHPDKRALQVPVKVEIEVNGEKMIQDLSPYVRAEEAGRWTICGGI